MAKEPAKKTPNLVDILNIINKKHGIGTLLDMSNKDERPEQEYVATGMPSLNTILGKGIPKGRVIEVFGLESSGKTTLCLYMLKHLQKVTGKSVAYIDLERAVDWSYSEKLGIDLDNLLVSSPETGEQAMDIAEKLCQSKQIAAIVFDSVAQLVPGSVAAKEIDGSLNIASVARLMSQHLPRVVNAAGASNTTLIFINQIRMNIGVMYGNPEVTPGGMALKYAASIRLKVSSRKPKEEDKRTGGIFVKIKSIKNKLTEPFLEHEVFLEFDGKGFDEYSDTLAMAVDLKVIEKSGGWYSYDTIKVMGWENFVQAVKNTDGVYEKIFKTLQTMK